MGFRRRSRRSLHVGANRACKGFATPQTGCAIAAPRARERSSPELRPNDEVRARRRLHRRERSPRPAQSRAAGSSALVEECVDGGFDGCGHGCRHVRRRQLPADRQRALQRLAGVPAVMALCEMGLHRRAHARIDLAFEMLREQRHDSGHGDPRGGAIAGRPNAGASSSRMATLARCSRLLTASTLVPRIVATSGADNPSTSRNISTSR